MITVGHIMDAMNKLQDALVECIDKAQDGVDLKEVTNEYYAAVQTCNAVINAFVAQEETAIKPF